MCAYDKYEPNVQKPMAELLAAYENNGIAGVREVAGGCPACILAAIIIWRKQNPSASEEERYCPEFDFKKERTDWLNERTEHEYAY
jgi:hypothetical protein